MHLSILYEDDSCIVVNKPAGIPVHPGSPHDERETILDAIREFFAIRDIPFSESAVLVHRLDKDTTGCLLIAKNADAHEALQKQFMDREVSKSYLAIVAGVPKHPEARIDAPVGRNLTDRKRMSVLRTSVSREAQTTYEVLAKSGDAALLRCDPHTGRTHQIRVHLSSIGHPILGDSTYASPQSRKISAKYGIERIALHAWKLMFESPTGGTQNIAAPLPQEILSSLKSTGFKPQEGDA